MESKDSKPTNEDVFNKLGESGENGAVSFLFDQNICINRQTLTPCNFLHNMIFLNSVFNFE